MKLIFLFISIAFGNPYLFWHGSLTSKTPNIWPYGILNELVVESGSTITLSSSQSYDYKKIWIKSGGTLIINPPTPGDPVYLGSRDTFIIEGTLRSQSYFSETSSRSFLTPDFKTIIYQNSLSRGGNGGGANCGFSGGGGGGAPFGSGGGGVFGAPNGNSAGQISGGSGGIWSGACAGFTPSHTGGNGGNSGINGGILYIKSHKGIQGSGTIYIKGENGSGGSSPTNKCGIAGAAGGGGGGGGGAGGKLYYNAKSFSPTININNSIGSGAGGGPPNGFGCNNGGIGGGGGSGSNGPSGIIYNVP